MAKYRKKPVIVEAEVYRGGLEDGILCDDLGDVTLWKPYVNSLEGRLFITPGDYIITGVKGERYPCKPDIFEMTYEKVEEQANDPS